MSNFIVNTPNTIASQMVTTTNGTTWTPPPQSVQICKPLSYQFQVVEYVDKNDKIMKVELQVQQTEHDNYGREVSNSGFKPVPRVRLPYHESV